MAERLNVDEKIKVVKYLQEKGTFKVKGAIVLVAEKLAVSEPTVYRYLKKMEK
ncbi:helix-turn-helix domain-containing protein [Coprobacillaceae bacterium CR2/5/TPMF4]|nr:helix-turn-helix domain-containing protein [Coprobacillaceae bacterium CR2/5/TPMF4]